jgi:hypothetical protein
MIDILQIPSFIYPMGILRMMIEKTISERGRFEMPGTYRIQVKGVLDPKWSDWLGGMQITTQYLKGGVPVTRLIGQVADQTALAGILNAIYDMHLTLLSVEYLNGE